MCPGLEADNLERHQVECHTQHQFPKRKQQGLPGRVVDAHMRANKETKGPTVQMILLNAHVRAQKDTHYEQWTHDQSPMQGIPHV